MTDRQGVKKEFNSVTTIQFIKLNTYIKSETEYCVHGLGDVKKNEDDGMYDEGLLRCGDCIIKCHHLLLLITKTYRVYRSPFIFIFVATWKTIVTLTI